MHFLIFLLLVLHLGTQFSQSILTKNGLTILNRPFHTRKNARIDEKECLCVKNDECSCCEKVHIFDAETKNNMCSTFFYNESGLGVNIFLDSNLIKSANRNITQVDKICTTIPQDVFSKTCVEMDQLNFNPEYLTICSKMNFLSKYEKLQTKFGCVNVTRKSSTKDQTKSGQKTSELVQQPGNQVHLPIVKIKFTKYPFKFSDTSNFNSNSSSLQVTTSKSLVTLISIEITPSEISTAISTSEENPIDQMMSGQSPLTQTVPAPVTSTVKAEDEKITQSTVTRMSNKIKPINLVMKTETTNNTSPEKVSFNETEMKQNVTLKHHIKVIGLSDMSTIKKLVRFPEVTTSLNMSYTNSTSVDQGISSTTDKSKDKLKTNKRKIRFPEGRTVRRSRSNLKSAGIVNQPREEQAEKIPTTLSSMVETKNMPFLDHPLVRPDFALGPTVNVFFPFSGPPDLTTPFQFDRFPSRTPPFIQHSPRDVEELETPIPPHDFYPFNKLIRIIQKKSEANKSDELTE